MTHLPDQLNDRLPRAGVINFFVHEFLQLYY